jgi:hypothetical protein
LLRNECYAIENEATKLETYLLTSNKWSMCFSKPESP